MPHDSSDSWICAAANISCPLQPATQATVMTYALSVLKNRNEWRPKNGTPARLLRSQQLELSLRCSPEWLLHSQPYDKGF